MLTVLEAPNCHDIPATLRKLADAIEAGEYSPDKAVVVLDGGPGALSVHAAGRELERIAGA